MRILFIVPYTPSLIRVRPYQLVRHLIRRGHNLTLMTLWSGAEDRTYLKELAEQGVEVKAFRLPHWRSLWNCSRAVFSRLPLQAAYCWQPQLLTELALMIQESHFDAVHVEHLRGALFGLQATRLIEAHAARDRSSSKPPVVWDSVDCISYLFGQAKRQCKSLRSRCMTGLEEGRTRRYEGWLVRQFDHVLVTSETDRDQLKTLELEAAFAAGRRATISVLSNGVDLDYFSPSDEQRDPATLVFSGKMSYHANVTSAIHLVRDVMPLIWAKRPDVRVMIVGKNPTREVRNLAGHGATERGSGAKSRVVVTGGVSDLRPYLRKATAAVVPLVYGAGIQNKVLEAMACATPVVASPRAVSALRARSGQEVLLGDSAREIAENVLLLLGRPELQKEIGRAGLSYVNTHHNWNGVAERLEQIYLRARESKEGVSSAA